MASSGNFPLWSPLIKGAVNLSNGNTRFDGTTSSRGSMTSFAVPTDTKFYVECLVTHATGYNIVFGVANPEFNVGTYDESDATMNGILFRANNSSSWDTCSLTNGVRGSFGANVGTTSARVLAMTVNRVDNEIKMYLDNSLQHTISISATEVYHIVCSFTGGANSAIHMNINGGHDSTGAGDFTAGGNADENGFGDFQNSPPSGFLAPSSANLPIGTEIDPAGDNGADENPTKQFGIITYTGTGSAQSFTGLGFQPDFVWAKSRSASQSSRLADSNRGSAVLFSDTTGAEDTTAGISFDSDGFSWTNSDGSNANDSGVTYVAWCWKCNGGTTTSDSSGDITVTRQTNDASKFSILTYTGNGSAAQTVGHGLGVEPDFVVARPRDNAGSNWVVWIRGLTLNGDSSQFLKLNTNDAVATSGQIENVSSSLITIDGNANLSGKSQLLYCWANVEGMQRFGLYEGNSDNDGPYIHLGFRARYWFFKEIDAADDWVAYDTARDTINSGSSKVLRYDSSTSEFDGTTRAVDVTSTGLKIRTSNGTINTNGNTYAFGAWGDVPAKYGNTF